MHDLEHHFREAMIDLYRRAKIEVNYDARWFLDMVVAEGAVLAARRLILSEAPASGFTRLWEAKRLDLTVEHEVLQPQWAPLFDDEVRAAARERLRQYGMPTS